MSLHLRFAPSADLLLDGFLKELREVWTDPFSPPTLLVPNPALGKWLALRMADRPNLGLGSVMSLERGTLERFLWQSLKPSPEMRRLDANTLQQILCALVNDSLCEKEIFKSVCEYLMVDGILDPRRRAQLASQIARQFQEYEFNRPSVWDAQQNTWRMHGIDATWLQNGLYTDSPHEPWQAELYRLADLQLKGTPYISLPRLHRLRRESGWEVPPGHIFLFQVAKISHFHRNTLLEIAQMPGMELHVHLTNPCAEFWEDVDTTRHKRRRWKSTSPASAMGIPPRKPSDYGQSELSGIVSNSTDQPLLELWGKTGKENIYLWCPAAEWDFEYSGAPESNREERDKTLLVSLQESLLQRTSGISYTGQTDNSLAVIATPDPGRAVEYLHAQLLSLIAQGSLQRLEDAVVYLPDSQGYLPHIQRIFGAHTPGSSTHIPYSILGLPIKDSLYAQGVDALLKVVEGAFDRASVFRILRNPLVQCSRKILPDSVSIWESWSDSLGIFRGYDKEHRSQMGDAGIYAEDVHTFAIGFARLLAGNLADNSVHLGYGTSSPVPIPVFRDYDTSDAELLASFVSQVEFLHQSCCRISQTLLASGISKTVEQLESLFSDWLGAIPEGPGWDTFGESRVQKEFRTSLPQISLQESLCGRTHMSLAEMLEQVKACLPQELPPASKAWVGGITFAPLRQGMVLPHPVIFVLGLDAGTFPGVQTRTPSDILSQKRIVGDSDPVRDNRFAFLELFHSARQHLFLMFRSRNMQKEEDLQPASVLLELETFLKDQGIKDIRRNLEWIPWEDPSSLENLWDTHSAKLLALQKAPRYRKRHSPKAISLQADTTVTPTFQELRDFFRNPLEYHVRHALGLRDSELPETLSASNEPLETGKLESAAIRTEIWCALLEEAFPWSADPLDIAQIEAAGQRAAEIAFNSYYWQGKAPEAQFAEMEKQALYNWTNLCIQEIPSLWQKFPDHRFLRDTDASLGMESMAAGPWNLRHKGALAPRSDKGIAAVIGFAKEGQAADNAELWLSGVLQQLQVKDRLQIVLVQLNRKDSSISLSALKPWNSKEWIGMENWLSQICKEMLSGQCAEHLPFAAIQKVVVKRNAVEWNQLCRESLEDVLDGIHPAYNCYLEAFEVAEPQVPDLSPETIQQIAKDRYAPFLERRVHEA